MNARVVGILLLALMMVHEGVAVGATVAHARGSAALLRARARAPARPTDANHAELAHAARVMSLSDAEGLTLLQSGAMAKTGVVPGTLGLWIGFVFWLIKFGMKWYEKQQKLNAMRAAATEEQCDYAKGRLVAARQVEQLFGLLLEAVHKITPTSAALTLRTSVWRSMGGLRMLIDKLSDEMDADIVSWCLRKKGVEELDEVVAFRKSYAQERSDTRQNAWRYLRDDAHEAETGVGEKLGALLDGNTKEAVLASAEYQQARVGTRVQNVPLEEWHHLQEIKGYFSNAGEQDSGSLGYDDSLEHVMGPSDWVSGVQGKLIAGMSMVGVNEDLNFDDSTGALKSGKPTKDGQTNTDVNNAYWVGFNTMGVKRLSAIADGKQSVVFSMPHVYAFGINIVESIAEFTLSKVYANKAAAVTTARCMALQDAASSFSMVKQVALSTALYIGHVQSESMGSVCTPLPSAERALLVQLLRYGEALTTTDAARTCAEVCSTIQPNRSKCDIACGQARLMLSPAFSAANGLLTDTSAAYTLDNLSEDVSHDVHVDTCMMTTAVMNSVVRAMDGQFAALQKNMNDAGCDRLLFADSTGAMDRAMHGTYVRSFVRAVEDTSTDMDFVNDDGGMCTLRDALMGAHLVAGFRSEFKDWHFRTERNSRLDDTITDATNAQDMGEALCDSLVGAWEDDRKANKDALHDNWSAKEQKAYCKDEVLASLFHQPQWPLAGESEHACTWPSRERESWSARSLWPFFVIAIMEGSGVYSYDASHHLESSMDFYASYLDAYQLIMYNLLPRAAAGKLDGKDAPREWAQQVLLEFRNVHALTTNELSAIQGRYASMAAYFVRSRTDVRRLVELITPEMDAVKKLSSVVKRHRLRKTVTLAQEELGESGDLLLQVGEDGTVQSDVSSQGDLSSLRLVQLQTAASPGECTMENMRRWRAHRMQCASFAHITQYAAEAYGPGTWPFELLRSSNPAVHAMWHHLSSKEASKWQSTLTTWTDTKWASDEVLANFRTSEMEPAEYCPPVKLADSDTYYPTNRCDIDATLRLSVDVSAESLKEANTKLFATNAERLGVESKGRLDAKMVPWCGTDDHARIGRSCSSVARALLLTLGDTTDNKRFNPRFLSTADLRLSYHYPQLPSGQAARTGLLKDYDMLTLDFGRLLSAFRSSTGSTDLFTTRVLGRTFMGDVFDLEVFVETGFGIKKILIVFPGSVKSTSDPKLAKLKETGPGRLTMTLTPGAQADKLFSVTEGHTRNYHGYTGKSKKIKQGAECDVSKGICNPCQLCRSVVKNSAKREVLESEVLGDVANPLLGVLDALGKQSPRDSFDSSVKDAFWSEVTTHAVERVHGDRTLAMHAVVVEEGSDAARALQTWGRLVVPDAERTGDAMCAVLRMCDAEWSSSDGTAVEAVVMEEKDDPVRFVAEVREKLEHNDSASDVLSRLPDFGKNKKAKFSHDVATLLRNSFGIGVPAKWVAEARVSSTSTSSRSSGPMRVSMPAKTSEPAHTLLAGNLDGDLTDEAVTKQVRRLGMTALQLGTNTEAFKAKQVKGAESLTAALTAPAFGFTESNIKGDGNCAFTSFAEALLGKNDAESLSYAFRLLAVQVLQTVGQESMGTTNMRTAGVNTRYLRNMIRQGTYGSDMELASLAKLFGVQLVTFKWDEKAKSLQTVALSQGSNEERTNTRRSALEYVKALRTAFPLVDAAVTKGLAVVQAYETAHDGAAPMLAVINLNPEAVNAHFNTALAALPVGTAVRLTVGGATVDSKVVSQTGVWKVKVTKTVTVPKAQLRTRAGEEEPVPERVEVGNTMYAKDPTLDNAWMEGSVRVVADDNVTLDFSADVEVSPDALTRAEE